MDTEIAKKLGKREGELAAVLPAYAAALRQVIFAGDRLDSAHALGAGLAEARAKLKAAKAAAVLILPEALAAEVAKIDDVLAEVVAVVGDDGTGDIGLIVRQALRDDPAAVADIVAIVREARADALAAEAAK